MAFVFAVYFAFRQGCFVALGLNDLFITVGLGFSVSLVLVVCLIYLSF